jgi:hypothetical protein
LEIAMFDRVSIDVVGDAYHNSSPPVA